MKKFVMHWSHLSALSRCGVSFQKKYVQRQPEAPSPGLIIGSSGHETYEALLKFIMSEKRLLPLDTCQAIAKKAFDERWPTVHLNAKERLKGDREVEKESRDKVVQLVDLFYREIAPTIDPIGVEVPWKIELRNSPFDIAGTWDVILADDVLLDFKNVAKSPGANAAHADEQCSLYSLAYYATYGVIPRYRRISLVKLKTPKIVPQETTRTVDDFRTLRRRMEMAWKMIDAGIYLPASQDSWICSKSFCSYAAQGACEFFRESSAPQVESEE